MNFLKNCFLKAIIVIVVVQSLVASDDVSVAVEEKKEQPIPVVRREISRSDQVKFGTAIMVYVIVVMTLFKNYNPE